LVYNVKYKPIKGVSMKTIFTTPIFLLCLIIAFACGGNEIDFTPEKDNAAMAKIEKNWTSGGFNLNITEDIPIADEEAKNTCRILHVVRGGGRSEAHTESTSIGCGGCINSIKAFIKATASGGPFLEPIELTGDVYFGDLQTTDPYALPYKLSLSGNSTNCTIGGNILENGSLQITVNFLSNGVIWFSTNYTM